MWGTWVAQSVKRLPSAWIMIPGSWDRALHRAPYSAKSLLLPLPLPLLMLARSLSEINKSLKKKKKRCFLLLMFSSLRILLMISFS